MRIGIVLAALFALLFFPIVNSSIKRVAESSPALHSPALISPGLYNAEPEELGALVFEHSDGLLEADEVREIAKGFTRLKKENEEWATRFIEGYHSRAGKENRKL
jgi:hypothetical protein